MPKKPIQDITQEELNKEAEEGIGAQETELDKLWYYLNYYSLYSTVQNAERLDSDPSEDVDNNFERPEDYQKAVEDYRIRFAESYFQEGEKEKIHIPIDSTSRRKISKASDVIENDVMKNVLRKGTLENLRKGYTVLGLLQAKIAMECGRDYEKILNSLPGDEENREEKAEYLHLTGNYNKTILLSKSFKDLQNNYYMGTSFYSEKMMEKSPIPNVDALKSMTIGEFLDAGFNSPKEQEFFLAEAKKMGLPCTRETNAYDYFKKKLEGEQQKQKNQNPDYKIKTVTDKNIYKAAAIRYMQDLMREVTQLSSNMVRENLSEKDRKTFDQGMKLLNRREYSPPNPIKKWVQETGRPMFIKNRADNINDQFHAFSEEADRREPYKMEEDPVFSRTYGNHLSENASPYERFLCRHIGAKAVMDTPAKQREHLAMVFAANEWKIKHPDRFDPEAVQKSAKSFLKMDVFKNFSDAEVTRALTTRERAMEAPLDMLRKKFGVPESGRAEYIRKMKELSESMVPSKGQSEKYTAMKNAVDAIAALDPEDPDIEAKLIRANGNLLGHTIDYTKGKKSMRRFRTSQDRFDNSIDVLAVAHEHVPGFRRFAKQVVDRTNEVRKAHVGDENYVDLSAYGTERALRHVPKNAPAYEKRIEADADAWLKKAGFDPDKLKKESAEAGPLNLG